MRPQRAFLLSLSLVLPLAALAAGSDAPTLSTACTPVQGAEVCTWVALESGAPVELGATVPLAIIEAVPLDAPMVWPPAPLARVDLPAEARRLLGIDHLAINWEAHGHPPAAFMTGHFDFHFNTLTPAQVDAIECDDRSKPLHVPAGYTLPDIDVPGLGTLVGLCVPKMGMHAMPEADGIRLDAFEASMIIGYYAGMPTFFEPMVSREALLSRRDFTLPMPRVHGVPTGVHYPTAFRAEYDERRAAYRLVFSGFSAE
jgi:hypothetical protein